MTVLALMALWFRQMREAEASSPFDYSEVGEPTALNYLLTELNDFFCWRAACCAPSSTVFRAMLLLRGLEPNGFLPCCFLCALSATALLCHTACSLSPTTLCHTACSLLGPNGILCHIPKYAACCAPSPEALCHTRICSILV